MDTTRTLSVRGSTSVDGRTTSSCYSGSGKRTSMEKPHSTTPLPAWCPPCEPLAQTTDSCFSSQDAFARSSGRSVLDVLAGASLRVLRRYASAEQYADSCRAHNEPFGFHVSSVRGQAVA